MAEIQEIRAVFASPLWADDQYLKTFNSTLHQLSVNRLLSSLDHLQLAAHSLEHDDGALVYSQYSLIRTALATASAALWLVRGDIDQRRSRALNLASYDLDQQVKFARSLLDAPDRRDPRNDALREECQAVASGAKQRFDAMYEAYQSIPVNGHIKISTPRDLRRFGETDAIIEIGDYLQQRNQISDKSELLLQYRIMSGYVHGLIWSTYSGSKVRNYHGDKSAMVELKGNPSNIYKGIKTAFVVATAAQTRLVELAGHPESSAPGRPH